MNINDIEMKPRTCCYRHCTTVIEGKASKKYCCDNHRKCEFTLRKRELILQKKYYDAEIKRVDMYTNIFKEYQTKF
jgi:hypothetical protein